MPSTIHFSSGESVQVEESATDVDKKLQEYRSMATSHLAKFTVFTKKDVHVLVNVDSVTFVYSSV